MNGKDGADGVVGAQGLRGEMGERGAQGEPGPQGVPGIVPDDLREMVARAVELRTAQTVSLVEGLAAELEAQRGVSVDALAASFVSALEKECGDLLPAVAVKFEKRIKRDEQGRVVGIVDVVAD